MLIRSVWLGRGIVKLRVLGRIVVASLTAECIQALLSLAQYSDTTSAPARSRLSFPCACLARVRNPETGAWTGKKDRDSSRGSHARE